MSGHSAIARLIAACAICCSAVTCADLKLSAQVASLRGRLLTGSGASSAADDDDGGSVSGPPPAVTLAPLCTTYRQRKSLRRRPLHRRPPLQVAPCSSISGGSPGHQSIATKFNAREANLENQEIRQRMVDVYLLLTLGYTREVGIIRGATDRTYLAVYGISGVLMCRHLPADEDSAQSAFILELHNKCRAKHEDTSLLTWSTDLQRTAEAWAGKCNYQVSTRMLGGAQHILGHGVGRLALPPTGQKEQLLTGRTGANVLRRMDP